MVVRKLSVNFNIYPRAGVSEKTNFDGPHTTDGRCRLPVFQLTLPARVK